MHACSCIGESTIKEAVKNADAVVFGTILSKQIIIVNDTIWTEIPPGNPAGDKSSIRSLAIARYQLLVADIYKGGITTDTLTIQTGVGGGDCGIRFEVGTKYVVYGMHKTYLGREVNDFKPSRDILWTNSCLRTTSYFQEEIAGLRKFAKSRKKVK